MTNAQIRYSKLSEFRQGTQETGFNRHNFNKKKGLSKIEKIERKILGTII